MPSKGYHPWSLGCVLCFPSPLSELPAVQKKSITPLLSHFRADQMPGPPQEGQLMCTLFLSLRQ